MKYKYIILFCLISVMITGPFLTSAQHDKEVGIMIGMMQYNGDLTHKDGFAPQNFGGGILFRYYIAPRIDFKANILYGYVHAADADNPETYSRNLSFKSHILDISAQLEINILPFISGKKKRNWSPYVFGGIAVFNFNPKAEYMGNWYELQPLGTEGQGTKFGNAKYKRTVFAIPYGIGFKYGFKSPKYFSSRFNLEMWNIGFELSQRKTFTDHLDDVGGFYPESLSIFTGPDAYYAKALCDRSREINLTWSRIVEGSKTQPRGNTANKDVYMFYGITITKTFRPSRCYSF